MRKRDMQEKPSIDRSTSKARKSPTYYFTEGGIDYDYRYGIENKRI